MQQKYALYNILTLITIHTSTKLVVLPYDAMQSRTI